MKVVALSVLLASCGGASMETRTAYAVEVAKCIANEQAIVDRSGTTEEQDYADLTAERNRCDAALNAVVHGGVQ
jgi:hypothetical protein